RQDVTWAFAMEPTRATHLRSDIARPVQGILPRPQKAGWRSRFAPPKSWISRFYRRKRPWRQHPKLLLLHITSTTFRQMIDTAIWLITFGIAVIGLVILVTDRSEDETPTRRRD